MKHVRASKKTASSGPSSLSRSGPFVIIGNPDNRRVTLFQDALASQGQPPARVLSWIDLLRTGNDDPFRDVPRDEPAILRIDSFGEDFEVTRLLLHRGEQAARDAGAWTLSSEEIDALPYDRGRILAPAQEHFGFLNVLRDLSRAIDERPELRAVPAPKSIELLFDKSACAHAFADAKISTARPLYGVSSPEDLRVRMHEAEMSRVFVKLTSGSSASCLALFSREPRKREWLFTSMEIDGERLYNSLRPRRYETRASIDRLLTFLFREGSHVEEHVAKARISGRYFDTRMLAIAGDVAFTVVRKSQHPITNLHLGGERGTLEELADAVSEDAIAAAHASVRKVAALHDGLHVGVDVMFTADGEDHRVLEANAFGDLLPNLTNSDGLSVYECEIKAALAKYK